MTVRHSFGVVLIYYLYYVVVLAFSMTAGSRSMQRRLVILCILLGTVPAFYHFRFHSQTAPLLPSPLARPSDIKVALAAVATFILLSFPLKFPLPLNFLFSLFFSACFQAVTLRGLLISYLVMPVVAGCCAWLIGRIFIRGVLFVPQEDSFKLALSWCGLIYPISVAVAITSVTLRYFPLDMSDLKRSILGQLVLMASFFAAYILFKVFFRAWLKRRVFLKYPQEYALYLERSERIEQGDREARGLGPIQNYYNYTGGSIANGSLSVTKQSTDTISVLYQTPHSPSGPSPAIIAGKLALNRKRTEELFRPALIILAIASLLSFTSLESLNILNLIRVLSSHIEPPITTTSLESYLPWTVLVISLIGGIFLAQRPVEIIGRFLISDMKPSQAFTIQFATLATFLLGLFLHPLPLTPLAYLLAAISASILGQEEEDGKNGRNSEQDRLDGSPILKTSPLYSIYTFWFLAAAFAYSVGILFRPQDA